MTLLVLFFAIWASAESQNDLERGRYIARAAECESCHTDNSAQPFAGGYRIDTPYGAFFSPNVTPDRTTGIGQWTLDDFRRALRFGTSPSGQVYYPSFPYRSYSKMSDADIAAVFAYFRSLTPIMKTNRPHELRFPYDQRWLMRAWQELFFRDRSDPYINIKVGVGPFEPVPVMPLGWNRGAYLTEAVLHCAECHTTRNSFGAPIVSLWLAGSGLLIGGRAPPNITPDRETGLSWSQQDWITFLASGLTPDKKTPGGEMAQVVRATSQLSKEDRAAVVQYLMSQDPVWRPNGER